MIRKPCYFTQVQETENLNSDLRREINILSRELNSLRESKEETSRIEEDREAEFTSKLREIEEVVTKERLKVETVTQEYCKMEESKNDVTKKLETMSCENKRLSGELSKAREEAFNSTEKLKSQIKYLTEQISELEESLNLKSDSIDTLKANLKENESCVKRVTHSLLEILGNEVISSDEKHLDIDRILEKIKLKVKTMEQQIESIMNEKTALNESLKEARSEVEMKERQISKLTKELEVFNEKEIASGINESVDFEGSVQDSFSRLQGNERKCRDEVIENTLETCKEEIYSEYESNLKELKRKHEEERSLWKAKLTESERRKDEEMNSRISDLTLQWNNEKKELEKLAKIAADAFKNGTNSVDLLKEQVARQRTEIEEVKRSHMKEVGELQALLEVKRQKGRNVLGEMKGGGSLDEAAEFEYLRNILYQYMLGKETQTLAKVLCAVVKFNDEQKRQIVEHEDKKQNLLKKLSKLEHKL